MNDEWLARMAEELRRRGMAGEAIEQAVAEARSHLRDSGEPPLAVFGLPEAYAAGVASSLVGSPVAMAVSGASLPGPQRLVAQGVGKRYGRRWVFRGVDLTVRAGEAVAVVGANGVGKSTFLRICAGLVRPDQGAVMVEGSIGYCPQHAGVLNFLRADEHFALVGVGGGMSRTDARRAGHRLAADLQWNAAERRLVRHLSGGTQQKLNLVLSALGDPDVLLLDEPYQGFDQGSYLDFWKLVWHWREAGKAVVVVTHLLENLDRVDGVLDLTALARPEGVGR